MLEFITETKDVWENMRDCGLPLVLYGMGNGADAILDKMAQEGLEAAGIFASDEFVRGQKFRGFTVEHYGDIKERLGNFAVVIAFASELPDVLARFKKLAEEHTVFAPHLPLYAGSEAVDRDWLAKYEARLQKVYCQLADDASRSVFSSVLNYKLSGKPQYLWQCETERFKDLQQLLKPGSRESYLDLGAYDGDTIREFLKLTGGSYGEITAVEADRRNYRKLCAKTEGLKNVHLIEAAVWNEDTELEFSDSGGRQSTLINAHKRVVKAVRMDRVLGEKKVSWIKMDVEGAEKEALLGLKEHIMRDKPKMFIAAYHYDNDFFELPELIRRLNPEYKIYLRKHPYVPAWEMNFITLEEGTKKVPAGQK